MIRSISRSLTCILILGAALSTRPACAEEATLLNVTLDEPAIVAPAVVAPVVMAPKEAAAAAPVTSAAPSPAESDLLALSASGAQAGRVIRLLPPALPSQIGRRAPSRLAARGGTANLRFPSPSLDSPAFAPEPPSTSVPTPAPLPSGKGWPWSASATFGGVKPWVAVTGRRVGNAFGIGTIHGVAGRGGASEHPGGLALDFMVYSDARRGDAVADYLMRNAAAERVQYLIWKQRIWHAGDAFGAWQPMEDRGSITANHYDHVHASFLD